jgi:MHS family proline/betaine transporter-like MFS transporter
MIASSVSGLLIATIVSFIFANNICIFTNERCPEWAWRLPFLSGMVIALFGYYLRRTNLESPDFQKALQEKTFTIAPILDAVRHYKSQMLITTLIAGQTAALAYLMFTLITPMSILTELHSFTRNEIYILSCIGQGSLACMCVLSGYLSDKIKVDKAYIMMTSAILCVLLIAPTFSLLLSGSFKQAILGQLIFGFLGGLHAGPQHIYMQELFPSTNRYSAVSFSFSLGAGILGGLTPLISKLMIQNNGSPALWIMLTSSILCVALIYIPRSSQLGVTRQ